MRDYREVALRLQKALRKVLDCQECDGTGWRFEWDDGQTVPCFCRGEGDRALRDAESFIEKDKGGQG